MKKDFLTKIAKIAIVLTVLFNVSCSNDDDNDETQYIGPFNGSVDSVENIYTPETVQALNNLDFTIYTGNTPPSVEGTFEVSPMMLINSTVPGDVIPTFFPNYVFTLTNQNNNDLTIDFEGQHLDGSQQDSGDGTYISGQGNNFTVYLNLTSLIGQYPAQTAFVISGQKTTEGIANLQIAALMVDNGGNIEDEYIPNNTGRVLVDFDELAEEIEIVNETSRATSNGKSLFKK
ncbi:hypothetical protein [Aureivirga marina]|uniref:hypothetical protein n=1 Tax=Aureivirga marina TaxID=1182451 RepID=UPI0018CB2E50|nr:hypothetical protein [Aureivirga marina]